MSAKRSSLLLPLLILLNLVILGAFHTRIKEKPDEKEISEITDYIQGSKQWYGRVAPDFEFTLNDGAKFHLADEIGKNVIVLNFFATWCGPCRVEMPELNRYYVNHKDRHLRMIGIDANETKDLVDHFVQELKIPFPVGIDQTNIQFLFKVEGFPTTVVIGVDGRVQYYQSGAISNAEVAFDSLLTVGEEALKNRQGVTKEKYLADLAAEPASRSRSAGPQLTGRAKTIADEMNCVCGCKDKVLVCGCSTAEGMVKKLQASNLEGKTDEEIILALNKEFCVGSKHK